MAGTMGFFDYVSDNGVTYKVKGDSSNAGQTGGVAATSMAWYPRGWVLRYLLCEASGHPRRKVPVYDPAIARWVGGTGTLDLEVVNSATPVTFTITGRFGEKRTSRG